MFWGVSPALDLQDEYKKHCKPPKELNVFIIGGSDARHILKTISQCYKHEQVKIHFYVMEVCLELVGRQLLLLNVALEPPDQLGLILKTKTFMELYGNTLVRPFVAKYLTSKAGQLVKMITDLDYCYEVMKFINLSGLKYKERDYLEVLFKYWCDSDPFVICELWDRRLRQFLGMRYDSRMGVFDWDLHMKLYPAGAKQICPQEYKHWRNSGVAFTWPESDVSKPNRTLVSGVVPSGEKFLHYGYLGDVLSGPFITYGLDCRDAEMLRKSNNMNVNRATDVTEYNLVQMFHEIFNKEEYSYNSNRKMNLGAVVIDIADKRVVEDQTSVIEAPKNLGSSKSKSYDINDVTINFLSYSMLEHMIHKKQYQKLFNIIYFPATLAEKIDPNLIKTISSPDCVLMIENQNFVPSYKKEELDELGCKIKNKFSSIENIQEIPFNPNKDSYAKFIII